MTLSAIASVVIWSLTGHYLWFFSVALVEAIFAFSLRRRIRQAVRAAEGASPDLELLSLALARLEKEQFISAYLEKLRAELNRDGILPSRLIARLSFLIELLDSSGTRFLPPSLSFCCGKFSWLSSWKTGEGNTVMP